MRKTNFLVTAVVLAALFVMILTYFSLTGDGKKREADTTDSVGQADLSVTVTVAPTDTPTPAPTEVPVFIPGADELPMSVRREEISLPTEDMIVTDTGSGCTVEWTPVEGADYYVLFNSPDGEEFGISQIVNGTDSHWEYMESTPFGFLVFAYSDDAQSGVEDDEILAVFLNNSLIPTPTPTPEATEGPTPPRRPTATPRPTRPPTPTPTPMPYMIIVDKADCAFAVFSRDENGDYTVKVATFPAALGGSKTPAGTHKIGSKQAWKTWLDGTYSPFASGYRSGIYFHGPVYYSKDFGDMMVCTYEAIGTNASQGCVRTTVAGARFVYYNCGAGTVVEVVSSSSLVSYPGKPAIDPNYPTWDPTDPSPRPTPTGGPTATPTPTLNPEPTATPTSAPTATPTETPAPTETTVAATTAG